MSRSYTSSPPKRLQGTAVLHMLLQNVILEGKLQETCYQTYRTTGFIIHILIFGRFEDIKRMYFGLYSYKCLVF
jgi:hypothetical protein